MAKRSPKGPILPVQLLRATDRLSSLFGRGGGVFGPTDYGKGCLFDTD